LIPYRATQIVRAAMEGELGAIRKIQIVDALAESEDPAAPMAERARENLECALALEQRGYVHPLELPPRPCMYDYLREHTPKDRGWYSQGVFNSPDPVPENIGAEKIESKERPWIVKIMRAIFVRFWEKGATETVPAPKVKA